MASSDRLVATAEELGASVFSCAKPGAGPAPKVKKTTTHATRHIPRGEFIRERADGGRSGVEIFLYTRVVMGKSNLGKVHQNGHPPPPLSAWRTKSHINPFSEVNPARQ